MQIRSIEVDQPRKAENERDNTQHEAMKIVGEYLSVLDLPNFVMTSRWFASHADRWWQFYTGKIFDLHPPGIVPNKLYDKSLNWRGLFFSHYNHEYDLHYRRRAMLIRDGNIEQFKTEVENGIKIGSVTYGYVFDGCEIFGGREYRSRSSLHAVAHSASAENKKKALDYFFEVITKGEDFSENSLTILRHFIDIPDLSYWDYFSIKHYLSKECFYGSPIIDAFIDNDFQMVLTMMECGADLDQRCEIWRHHDFSVLDYVINEVATLIVREHTRTDFHARRKNGYVPFHVGSRQNYDDPAGLIDYVKQHYGELLNHEIANLQPARFQV